MLGRNDNLRNFVHRRRAGGFIGERGLSRAHTQQRCRCHTKE
jgi:hypothetical protein